MSEFRELKIKSCKVGIKVYPKNVGWDPLVAIYALVDYSAEVVLGFIRQVICNQVG